MSASLATGLAIALAATACFETGYVLQALEARRTDPGSALRLSLLARLARRPRWALGIALGVVGWGLQAVALRLAPVAVVQPALATGLFGLLYLGWRVLGEPIGRRELLAALAIVVAIVVLALVAPKRSDQVGGAGLVLTLVALGCVGVAPLALRASGARTVPAGLLVVGAAAADVAAVFAARLVGDELHRGRPVVALAAGAGAVVAVVGGLLAETTALQQLRATVVGPAVLVAQVVAPVLLAPVALGEPWASTPAGGVAALAALGATGFAAWLLARSSAAVRVREGGSAQAVEEAGPDDAGGGRPGPPVGVGRHPTTQQHAQRDG